MITWRCLIIFYLVLYFNHYCLMKMNYIAIIIDFNRRRYQLFTIRIFHSVCLIMMIISQLDLIYSYLCLYLILTMINNICVDHSCSDWTIYLFSEIAHCGILSNVTLFILLDNLTCLCSVDPLCLNLFLLNYSLFKTNWMNLYWLHFIFRLLISYYW